MGGVERILDVLEAFASRPTWAFKDLYTRTGLPPSSLHRVLRTLESRRYVEHTNARGFYRCGSGLLSLASGTLARIDVRTYARPVMIELRDLLDESVSLDIVIAGGFRTCIEQVVTQRSIKHEKPLGVPLPLHAGGPGKCLLAFMSDDEVNEVIRVHGLPKLTVGTITSTEELRCELVRIRERGYSVARDEREMGAAGVSAPIRNHEGKVIAALGIGCVTQRLTPEAESQYALLVKKAASRVSAALGYRPRS